MPPAEDVCNKHLKAPDMLIQCILVYLILYDNNKIIYIYNFKDWDVRYESHDNILLERIFN